MTDTALASGTYEVLRNRLREASADLRKRFSSLNEARAAVFGNLETRLLTTTHVTTEHNCIPRDIFASDGIVLLGYNVQFGLKTEIEPGDVLSVYRFDGENAKQESLETIADSSFRRDFQELYRYYRNATFTRFFRNGFNLYAIFQIGKASAGIKAFKWAIDGNQLRYIDNRSESEIRPPAQHAFQWKRASRDHHRHGKHPHISIEDRVFVECIQGDLTIKVEDNTEDGLGIYREPVDSPDQTLDDAETYYAILGNLILFKIRPYQERDFRYLVFSTKRLSVERLDSLGLACALLPDDHGIIFPNGFVLQTGVSKLFDHGLNNLAFDRIIKSPNGEDFLFLFANIETGVYLQLRYNLIRQEVDTPLVCHGQAFFENGTMLSMRASDVPQKHHALQVWQTPFTGSNFRPSVQSDSLLFKIGNQDLVRGMAECQEILSLIDKDESYEDLYADLAKRATNVLDAYFWLEREEACTLAEPLRRIREAATAAVDEFEKVIRVRNETKKATDQAESDAIGILKASERSRFEKVEDFVRQLASIRSQRGIIIQLRELRYCDLDRINLLESQLAEAADRLGVRCVQFLLAPESLKGYSHQIEALTNQVPSSNSTATAKKIEEQFASIADSLELLIETVSQLKIEDLAQRTAIVDCVGDALAQLNRSRSGLKTRMRELTTGELESDFASQSKLLDQAAASAIDSSETPERVDNALLRILLQVEELEGRYADSETLLLRLTEKRQSLCDLFESKRQQLVEQQTRQANSLVAAADRILAGIQSRASRIESPPELLAYFASDLMVDKLRKIANQLLNMGDSVRRDDVLSRLKAISDDSMRQQRDRRELQSDGNRTIRFGQHSFSIHQQPIELTTVIRNGAIHVHLTGTQYFQPLVDDSLDSARDLWDQALPSESREVYRAEFLAYMLATEQNHKKEHPNSLDSFFAKSFEQQVAWVREQMQARYEEGYVRGVHDVDAAKILASLMHLQTSLGPFIHSPKTRSLAWFVWFQMVPSAERESVSQWVHSIATVDRLLPNSEPSLACLRAISKLLRLHSGGMLQRVSRSETARYLFDWIRSEQGTAKDKKILEPNRFSPSQRAQELLALLHQHMLADQLHSLQNAVHSHAKNPKEAWHVAAKAVDAFFESLLAKGSETSKADPLVDYREEMTLLLLNHDKAQPPSPSGSRPVPSIRPVSSKATVTLVDMVGDHPRINAGVLELHYHHFGSRLRKYVRDVVPRWRALQETKHRLLQQADRRIKSQEFKARVLTSFVRNQLIDEVYLPRVGDNLAKQMGTVGENRRTDRMGLLLLISPPGYGKTTLMEYVANRLGLVFVKVNGPALGHAVSSLDPSEATNAAAREEVNRINMALEMGDNVMLYLDDIQHCNVELLQKFIPLCDATRRIEGVWDGASKTYDLRGRKFAVVMAGNPYTETGQRFQIPDMLANRADVYNLGEIIGDSRVAFEESYLENCLTSNVTLQPLARCSNADQQALIAAARKGTQDSIELESNLSPDSVQEMLTVLAKLQRVRDVVLTMNQAYIHSAAQSDEYRTEPPFKLQGSYRNMNRIAEKVFPVMNNEELERLILSSYQQDSQTLSRDSESNMLKFKELIGKLDDTEQTRWNSIKKTFVEKNRLKGLSGDDSTAQVLSSLLGISVGLDSIRDALEQAVAKQSDQTQKRDPDPRVIVQHAVPRVMTELIRSQFQLLYDGLRPVLEGVALQSSNADRLRAAIQDLLQRYRTMESAASKTPETTPEEDELER